MIAHAFCNAFDMLVLCLCNEFCNDFDGAGDCVQSLFVCNVLAVIMPVVPLR